MQIENPFSANHAKFGGHLNKNWMDQDLPRYLLAYNSPTSSRELNSPGLCGKSSLLDCLELKTLLLHSTSGKRLSSPSSGPIADLAFTTISCQTPKSVYSRKSIAGFKLNKSSLLGAKATLRKLAKYEFFYKLYFLGARFSNPLLSTKKNFLPCLPIFSDHAKACTKGASQGAEIKRKTRPLGSFLTFISLRNYLFTLNTLHKCKVCINANQGVASQGKGREQAKGNISTRKKVSLRRNSGSSLITASLAIKNSFLFNELDILDYDSFSKVGGFEIVFIKQQSRSFA
jgi:hypothetical protein